MSIFPQDLITSILYLLPVKSLVRFQNVSKSFHALINDLEFIKVHLQYSIETRNERFLMQGESSSIRSPRRGMLLELPNEECLGEPLKFCRSISPPEDLKYIKNHCNGLFCFYNYYAEILVWNPSIQKHKKLPERIDVPGFCKANSMIAIGYDAVNNDYKVVSIRTIYEGRERILTSDIQVYSLKEKAWRVVEDKWPWPSKFSFISKEGTYSNNNLYWLVRIQRDSILFENCVLVVFDLTAEKFRLDVLPPVVPEMAVCLKVMGGLLYVITFHHLGVTEYWVASNWTRLSWMPPIFSYNPLLISKNGQEILLEETLEHELLLCDKVNKEWRIVEVPSIPGRFLSVPCQGSLVLLNGDNDD